MDEENETSEFGKGYVYCLGLFLAHADRILSDINAYKAIGDEQRAYSMWFYSAADHLFDFDPQAAPTVELRQRCAAFKDRVLSLRLPTDRPQATEKDYAWAVQEAKDILRLTDKANGIDTIKGSWE